MTTVERTVFATSRAAEFLELRALQTQTGQPADKFGDVVVKELLDNALDAAETAGQAPIIAIHTHPVDGLTFVTVCDNGNGIAPATVADLCDFTVLVSDKAKYRGPARGAQGNALKTLLGIPFALGVDAPVVIESRGVRHELKVTVDRVGDVVVAHDTSDSDRTEGTSVTIPLPADLDIDAQWWAFNAALVNPHAHIAAVDHGNSGDEDGPVFYKPSGEPWSKWTPSAPSSPHWYDPAAFSELVHAHIRETARTGADKPLGEFVREFDGLSGTAKAKAVRAAADPVTHLSQLDGRDDLIAELHDAMLAHAKPTPASRLGAVGEQHYRRLLDDGYGVQRFWYKTGDVTVGGVAWIVEVAVADTDEPGRIWFACNHAPSFSDPLGRAHLNAGGVNTFGAESFLTAAGVDPLFDDRAAVVHIICGAPQFVDKGKVRLVVPPAVAELAAKALDGATKTLQREAEQRRKDARKADRAAARAREADQVGRQMSIKDAVCAVLPAAKQAAGDVVSARTLMYKVRPLIQQLTDRKLNPDYFTQTLLPEYERTVGPLPGLYYEPRGALHHPHDDKVIRLGTREVEAYGLPPWQFDKVLYIEKTGLEAQLAPYRLGERYDMAIIYGNGYSPTACRNLLARSEIRAMKLFVLHDADPAGYNIARTLGEATRRMPDHSVDVIDLGLTVPQAIELGLETETFTRKKDLPADLVLDPDALEWFTGTPLSAGYGKTHYSCTRCELNAFSSDGLAEFIEAGLQRHDATEKLVPPPDVLADHVVTVRDQALTDLVAAELERMVDIGAVVRRLVADHPDLADGIDDATVRDSFADDDTRSWRAAVAQLVDDDIDDTEGLADTVRARLLEQLGGDDTEGAR